LGISIERVKELENLSSKTALSDTEREYLDEYKECISEDGQISDKERRLLDKFAQSLGLDNETIKRLENSVKA
jgi:dsDNA-specific endonuclease/ATPase MutS2